MVEHSRHGFFTNFIVNLLAGIASPIVRSLRNRVSISIVPWTHNLRRFEFIELTLKQREFDEL